MSDLPDSDPSQAAQISSLERRWRPMSPGIDVAVLLKDRERDFSIMLLRFAAGAEAPLHEHPEGEQYLLLEGDLLDVQGRIRPGDFVHHPPGSRHAPSSVNGALVYVTWFGRLAAIPSPT